jgi:tetratricopeptide (TPR) repeat protein
MQHHATKVVRFSQAALVAVALLSGTATLLPALAASNNPAALGYFNEAMSAYQQASNTRAIELLEKAIQTDNNFSEAWYNLGALHMRVGNFEKGRAAYQQVLVLNPGDQQARLNLGLALEKLNRKQEALTAYRAIPSSSNNYAAAQQKIGVLQNQLATVTPPATKPVMTPAKPATGTTPATVASNKKAEPFASQLAGPTGMALGPNGEVFIANFSKNNIIKILPDGRRSLLVEGKDLNGPIGMVFDPRSGDLFVANYLKNTVARINPKGETTVVANNLKKPYNLLLDSLSNTLYVSEQESNMVSKIKL